MHELRCEDRDIQLEVRESEFIIKAGGKDSAKFPSEKVWDLLWEGTYLLLWEKRHKIELEAAVKTAITELLSKLTIAKI